MSDTTMMQVINPRTGSVCATVPACSAAKTLAAIQDARVAQAAWAARPVAERAKILMRIHDAVLQHRDELLDIIQLETGKNRASALDEVMDVAINARYYARHAARLLRPRRVRGALPVMTRTTVVREPRGVVGIIAPWNYPLTLTLSDALPALVAGNTVVVKPDAQTPLSALLGEQILWESGVPSNVFQVLPGTGAVVGTAIAENADYVMFTGSTVTGQQLAERTGRRLVGFSGELGGKNPMIVTQDANIRSAVTGAITGCFSNSGQLCVSIERILVDKAIAPQFTNRLVNRVEKLNIGTGGWAEDMGSLISPAHVTHVCQLVDDAVNRGATLLTGGPRPDLGPSFLAPILLTDVPPEAALYREEVFGPVVYIETVNNETEAIAKANDSNYGLAASIFAKPVTARRIARQLHAGSVNINEGFAAAFGSVAAPMGGMKHSGMGRRHGVTGLVKYTEPKTIAEQRIMPIAGPCLLPRRLYAATMTKMLRLGKYFL